jgi:toxin YhaV
LERLIEAVAAEKERNPTTYRQTPNAKLLKALSEIVFNRIPQDPANRRYRQGDSLGDDYKHRFRDKFGGGRFRVFFRYHAQSKIIIFAWVNDEKTLRTYGSKTDAYAVFASMLKGGTPPDDWHALVNACKMPDLVERTRKSLAKASEQ